MSAPDELYLESMSENPLTAPPFSPSLPAPVLEGLVAMFLAGRAPGTTEAYRQDLQDLARFLAIDQDAIPKEILTKGNGYANGLALAWRSDMLARKLAPATINRRLSALRSIVKLGRVLGLVPWALETASVPSESYRDTRGPGVEALKAVLGSLDGQEDSPRVRRDRALLRLMFDLALRRGEVVALDLENVDLGRGTVAIVGKGKRERKPLTLSPTAAAALQAWLEARGEGPGPLFLSIKNSGAWGGRLAGRGLWGIVKGWGAGAGIELHPHALRHSAVTIALDAENGNIRKVAKFSRHRDERTVMIYDDNRSDFAGEIAKKIGNLI